MTKKLIYCLTGMCLFLLIAPNVSAHCEIPCGIYDDEMRIKEINEHITTIEKSMNQITQLEKSSPVNYNQLVRWITNKEDHANKIQQIVSQYFLTQRIKPGATDYYDKLGLLHEMLLVSMKCKQTTDLEQTTKLKDLVKRFEKLYFADGN
jgi:nickel superoxide dismutase